MPGVLGNPDARRGIALGIKVEDQHLLADGGQGGTEIDGCGGLAHATFLIGDGKDAKRGGSGKHASHERDSFQLGSSVLTRTMWASASVELGINSLVNVHA